MSSRATNWAWSVRGLTPTQKLVLLAIAERTNPDDGQCFPSKRRIAEDTGLSPATIVRNINSLVEQRYIERESRFDNARQTSNIYRVTYRGYHSDMGEGIIVTPSGVSERDPNNLKEITEKKENINIWFDKAWNLYPKKKGKGEAEKKWVIHSKLLKDNGGPKFLFEKLEAFIPTLSDTPMQFIPHLATWLNQKRYYDEISTVQNINGPSNVYKDFLREYE